MPFIEPCRGCGAILDPCPPDLDLYSLESTVAPPVWNGPTSSGACRPCGPVQSCNEIPDSQLYSLEDTPLPFVLNCPPGFDCTQSGELNLNCCGQALFVSLNGMTQSQRIAAITDLVNQCIHDMDFCGGTNVPIQFYFNRPQVGLAFCPDGTSFSYTIPAGIVAALTQAQADSSAFQIAQRLASAHIVCITSTIPSEFCANSVFSAKVKATGLTVDASNNTWTATGLPTGLSIPSTGGNEVSMTGTPTVSGHFTIKVGIVTPQGDHQSKSFSICIVGINPSNATLPQATSGNAYTATFSDPSGCSTAPLKFSIISGSLPPGLTLNASTGVLSGTPTGTGTFNFKVQIQDSST